MPKSGEKKYGITLFSCFYSYTVQAIVNNFVPLLFITFQSTYNIPLYKITLLITVNFAVQLLVDLISVKAVDKIGYKPSVIIALSLATAGLGGITFLPEIIPDAYTGLLISVTLYAIGGGLLEVIISPITDSCPSQNKAKAMSILHSSYCWGHVGVVLLSTLFFSFIGVEHWKYLALIWALFPAVNIVFFAVSPVPSPCNGEKGMGVRELFKSKIFWAFLVMMLCAGASEQAVIQWASSFAESGLKVSKAMGDLLGPMLFALLMGTSRFVYGKFGNKIKLHAFMIFSCVLCVLSYLCICLIPSPIINLIACGICGFSVGIMWPGTYSTASATLKRGGTAMFALLALAGDLGCTTGPSIVGFISSQSGNMKTGILTAVVFPVVLLIIISAITARKKRQELLPLTENSDKETE